MVDNTTDDTTVYTDEAVAYRGVPRHHVPINHSVGEYVREQAHTNGMESFWSMFKRGFTGTYHKISPKHLHRYVDEFEGRHNCRPLDTKMQMEKVVRGSAQKRLRYQELNRWRTRILDGLRPMSCLRKQYNPRATVIMTVALFVGNSPCFHRPSVFLSKHLQTDNYLSLRADHWNCRHPPGLRVLAFVIHTLLEKCSTIRDRHALFSQTGDPS